MARTRSTPPEPTPATSPKRDKLSDMPIASEDGVDVYVPIDSKGLAAPVSRTVHHHRQYAGDPKAVELVVVHREDPFNEVLAYYWTAYDTNGVKADRSATGWVEASDAFADAATSYPDAAIR